MKIVELIRLEETKEGTIGVLKADKKVFCFTLEPPDRLNERNVSSIPAKQYQCVRYSSKNHGETFKVEDVPERSGILFHAGNIVEHTEGCILLGSKVGRLRGDRAVLNSGKTFSEFLALMKDEEKFHLTIKEDF